MISYSLVERRPMSRIKQYVSLKRIISPVLNPWSNNNKIPEKKLLRVSWAASAKTSPTTPTPAISTPNSTLKVDRKFVSPSTIIIIEPIISSNGPYWVSDLPTDKRADIIGTKKVE